MRKAILAEALNDEGESPLADFYSQRVLNQFNDVRYQTASHAFKVGHPNGRVDVPNKRGWIYMQRMLPDGDSTVLQCFVPSNKNGKSRVKFKAGQVINPRRTGDGTLTYYQYDGVPPSTPVDRLNGECIGYTYTGGAFGAPQGTFYGDCSVHGAGTPITTGAPMASGSAASWGTSDYYAQTNAYPADMPSGVPAYNEDDGFEDANPVGSAVISDTPPLGPIDGQLWWDHSFLRRWDATATAWFVLEGKTSGTVVEYLAGQILSFGKVVYMSTTDSKVYSADCRSMDSCNKVVGMVVGGGGTVGGIVVVQSTGQLRQTYASPWPTTPGVPLYLGYSGNLTDTPPAAGSGYYAQQICTVHSPLAVQIGIRIPIIRS